MSAGYSGMEGLGAARLQYLSILFKQVGSVGNNFRAGVMKFVCAFLLVMFDHTVKRWKEILTI
jgi:hypothetical protein